MTGRKRPQKKSPTDVDRLLRDHAKMLKEANKPEASQQRNYSGWEDELRALDAPRAAQGPFASVGPPVMSGYRPNTLSARERKARRDNAKPTQKGR